MSAIAFGLGIGIGVIIGWCWRTFQMVKDHDCANPDHNEKENK